MKHFSTILSAILLLAVAFLYYHVFANKKPNVGLVKTTSSTASIKEAVHAPIAYVELDSLNEKIVYIKEKRKILEAEQRAIETEWQNSYRGLENQKNNFIKKGNAITQQMAEEFQGQLIQQQQKLMKKSRYSHKS